MEADEESDLISTEGCFACQMNKNYPRSRRGRSRSSYKRSHNYGQKRTYYSSRRRSKRNAISATFSSLRPRKSLKYIFNPNLTISKLSVPVALNVSEWVESKNGHTKVNIKLRAEQTKHKRPILFIVPARSSTLLDYTVHGKDRDLFGLRHDSGGIWALYYNSKVKPSNSVINHHVRVIGLKSRQARHQHQHKELNMKVKIVVVKN